MYSTGLQMWTFVGIVGIISTELLDLAECVLKAMTDIRETASSSLWGAMMFFQQGLVLS